MMNGKTWGRCVLTERNVSECNFQILAHEFKARPIAGLFIRSSLIALEQLIRLIEKLELLEALLPLSCPDRHSAVIQEGIAFHLFSD